jgi:hypothetical protein
MAARKLLLSLTAILFILGTARIALADDLFVPENFATIQEAVAAASPGQRILVGPGVYLGEINFAGKNVELRSTLGPSVTIIDGNGQRCVRMGPGGSLIGFSLTNGTTYGGGIEVTGASSIIRGNVFDGNKLHCS